MLVHDPLALEFRPIPHQIEQRILSIAADESYISEVHHQLTPMKMFLRAMPRTFQFQRPWSHQGPFQYQPSLIFCFNRRELEHLFDLRYY
jgi:hypothetical protein